jgi:aldehyde oxidoreductase
MTAFLLNGKQQIFSGDPEMSLLDYLRLEKQITSPKDGCSGQGACGACTVEIDGKARLACRTSMGSLHGKPVLTMEGLPEDFRRLAGKLFAEKGAVQCGFCSPGFIMRAKALFNANAHPGRQEIIRAVNPNICRCTGYVKIVDAIEAIFDAMAKKRTAGNNAAEEKPGSVRARTQETIVPAGIGHPFPKYQSVETALGSRPFVRDLRMEGMLFGALKFSDHPRARVLAIDASDAEAVPGVVRVFAAADIPGQQFSGLIFQDWPLMVGVGQFTNCVGDVLAGVVAESEVAAREAVTKIKIEYQVLEPVTDVHEAAKPSAPQVHEGRSNVLENCSIRFGEVEKAFQDAAYVSSGVYETQRIEHAFLETETALATPESGGLLLYTQGQGAYVDRRLSAAILDIPEEKVRVVQVPNGGGFGGKEDLTVQGHASLFAWLLKKPVMVHLNREESIRMHPKRHPVWMDISLAVDRNGKFTALKLKAFGDTGAYASVGTKVMERVVGHATGGYTIPAVDIQSLTVYTNNIPSGAMRGFGVPQVTFAIESCIDEVCRMGGFDRWQIRYDNALEDGAKTATGQVLRGVGLKKTLLAVEDAFRKAAFAGIACGLKNTGVGNGMIDDSEVVLEVRAVDHLVIHHGWTEMGQGVHTMAIQTLHEETGLDPSIMEVVVDTSAGIPTGMTTSSRATALVSNAIIDAAKRLKADLDGVGQGGVNPGGVGLAGGSLAHLKGRRYKGKYVCDWTCKPGADKEDPQIHFAYGYATQVVVLDEQGKITRVIAAHDAGKIMNRMLFEGQIEGAVHMGLGYALTEDLPLRNGMPVSTRFKDLGILRASEMPEITVIGVEEKDPVGPYGAKGIGEIGMVPTAAAVANAFYAFDGVKRTRLPLRRNNGNQ